MNFFFNLEQSRILLSYKSKFEIYLIIHFFEKIKEEIDFFVS